MVHKTRQFLTRKPEIRRIFMTVARVNMQNTYLAEACSKEEMCQNFIRPRTRVIYALRNKHCSLRIGAQNSKVFGSIPPWNSEFFSLSHAGDKTKTIFL